MAAPCACIQTTRHTRDLDAQLRSPPPRLQAMDLFSGAGGLGLGLRSAGFSVLGIDRDPAAAAAFRANVGECMQAMVGDQADLPAVDLLAAGPPCQPFSAAGTQMGAADARNGLPAVTALAQRLRPAAVLVENVPNLLRHPDAEWLRRALQGLGYQVEMRVLCASRYGVAQRRRRLFAVALRDGPMAWPEQLENEPTALDALGPEAWSCTHGTMLSPQQEAYVDRYERSSGCRTARDLYPDRPARTLTARNLAAATSDMMRIRIADGRRRRLLPREAARLQSFPDWCSFQGPASAQMRQIGNAVPPLLAKRVAHAIAQHLS